MKRTTVTLPDELAGALEREARRRRLSVSQVMREALAAHLGLAGEKPRTLVFAALGASGRRRTARAVAARPSSLTRARCTRSPTPTTTSAPSRHCTVHRNSDALNEN